jgi:glutamate racemase
MTEQALPAPGQAGHDLRLTIGVFDSGVGGLSVLRVLRQHLPHATLLYVADSGHAPYGEKSEAFITARSQAIAEFLLSQGAQLLVVACNTATATSVHALRTHHPHLPIVGIEPGVKPAVAASRSRKVGVLATPGTLASERFARLIDQHAEDVQVLAQPCPGLAKAIEEGQLDTPTLRELIQGFCAPLKSAGVDTVVLGCTHYPFVAPLISEAMGSGVTLIDTSDAVARQTVRLARRALSSAEGLDGEMATACTRLWTSGDVAALRHFCTPWMAEVATIEALPDS